MFTFQNGCGTSEDSAGGHYNEEFFCKGVYSKISLEKRVNDSGISTMTSSPRIEDLNISPQNEMTDSDLKNIKEENNNSQMEDKNNDNFVVIDETNTSKLNNINNSSREDSFSTSFNDSAINDNNSNDSNLFDNYSTEETCITHDVRGVLLHHNGLQKQFTLSIAALQVTQVGFH